MDRRRTEKINQAKTKEKHLAEEYDAQTHTDVVPSSCSMHWSIQLDLPEKIKRNVA